MKQKDKTKISGIEAKAICRRLVEARKDCGITQEEAGQMIGADRKSISHLETTGNGYYMPQYVRMLACVSGISTDYLLAVDKSAFDFRGETYVGNKL